MKVELLVADVFGQLRAGPAALDVGGHGLRDPLLDVAIGVAGLEAVDDVRHPQHAAAAQHAGQPAQGDRLSEVGQVMQRIAAVHEVGGRTGVFVGQEPGMDDLDVLRAGAIELVGQPLEHQRRHVDCDHAPADRGSGERELPGAGAEVDDGGSGVQDAELLQQGDLLERARVLAS